MSASIFETQTSELVKASFAGKAYIRAKTSESVVLSGATTFLDVGLSLFNWGVAHTVPKSVVSYTDKKLSAIATGIATGSAQAYEATSTKVAQLSALTTNLAHLDAFDLVDGLLDSTYSEEELEAARVVPPQPEHVELVRKHPVASLVAVVARPALVPIRAVITAGKVAAASKRAIRRLVKAALDRFHSISLNRFSSVSLSALLARAARWLLQVHDRVGAVPVVQSAASHLPASLSSVDHRVVMLLTSHAEKKASVPAVSSAVPSAAADATPREEARDEELLTRPREQDSFIFEPIQDGLDSE